MKYQCRILTPLGEMDALVENDCLCRLSYIGQKYAQVVSEDWIHNPNYPVFVALRSQLTDYFAGQLRDFDIPIELKGTDFQLSVWALLRSIPIGTTTSYGALARQISEQQKERILSAQAVGGAIGHNPIAIIIPCHRVIGANGSLTGYAGGLDRKAALLALENFNIPTLRVLIDGKRDSV